MAITQNKNTNASGDVLWSQEIYGTDGDVSVLAAQIKVIADSTVAAGKMPARVEIWTATSGGTLTKALTIDSSQNTTMVGNATVPGLLKLSGIETPITAAAGGTQAGALALSATKSIHQVTTVSSANDSVKLPLATGSGTVHWIKNSAAANSCQVFGSGTDTIDAVATATGVAVAAGKSRIFVDTAAGLWQSLLGA
jgi:hypothetical protein